MSMPIFIFIEFKAMYSECQKYVPFDTISKSPCPPFVKGGTCFAGTGYFAAI